MPGVQLPWLVRGKEAVAVREEWIGVISHYYSHLEVAVFVLDADLRVGDTVHIKGHTSDFKQIVESMQKDHRGVDKAGRGDSVGIKLSGRVRVNDSVYKLIEEGQDAA